MYEQFYKLSNDPFRLLPDAGVCFSHRSSARAWAYLRYALRRGEGIVVVTGEPGSGKTTLAQRLLADVNPSKVIAVSLVANALSPSDLLRKLAYNLGLPVEGKDRAMLTLLLERHLIEIEHSQRRVLVVVDEAQTLSHQALDAMRLLTDTQSRSHPVLQLVLFGQQELEGVLSAPGMEQFQQRVIASCHLQAMNLKETKSYLEFRLAAADWRGDPSINGPAVMAVYRYSHGVPRHVNKICSRLLLHGSSEEKHALTERDVMAVVSDLRSELLVPADAGVSVEAAPAGSLSSVYELALVPTVSKDPRRAVVGTASDPTALDTVGPRIGMPASPPPVAKPPGTYDGGRYMFRVGYRSRGTRRKPWRATVRGWLRALRPDDRLLAASRSAVGSLRRLTARVGDAAGAVATRMRAGLLRLRMIVGNADWRPLTRQHTAVAAGTAAVAVALLVMLYGIDRPAQEPASTASSGLPVNEADVDLVSGVLAVGDGYRSLATMSLGGLNGTHDPFAALMVGELLSRGEPTEGALQRLIDPSLPPSSFGLAGNEAFPVGDGNMARPLLQQIAEASTDRMLDAVGRYENSLSVLVMARRPDAMSGQGANLWTLADESARPSDVPGMALRIPGGAAVDAAPDESPQINVDAGDAILAPSPSDESALADVVPVQPDVAESPLPMESPETTDTSQAGGLVDRADAVTTRYDEAVPEMLDALPATAAGDDVANSAVQTVADAGEPVTLPTDSISLTMPETRHLDGPGDTTLAMVGMIVSDPPVADGESLRLEVAGLIKRADKAIAEDRLLIPEDKSAFTYLQRALALDADHPGALRGIDRIIDRYAMLAVQALSAESYETAQRYVARGLRVRQNSLKMKNLQREIRAAREEAAAVALAEAEMARVAEAEVEVVEAPPAPLPKKEPSAFNRLMQLVEGI